MLPCRPFGRESRPSNRQAAPVGLPKKTLAAICRYQQQLRSPARDGHRVGDSPATALRQHGRGRQGNATANAVRVSVRVSGAACKSYGGNIVRSPAESLEIVPAPESASL